MLVQMVRGHSRRDTDDTGRSSRCSFLVPSLLFLLLCLDSELLDISLLLALWICFPDYFPYKNMLY